MKALMTTAALAAFLVAVPALAEDATAPAATGQPAATDTQPDAMKAPKPAAEAKTPAPDANAPATAESKTPAPDANAPATAESKTPPAGDNAAPAATAATPDKNAPATAAAAPAEKFLSKQEEGEVLASKMIGSTVYGPGDENLGDINDLIVAKDGGIHAVVIGVGGFLGIGEKNVAVAFSEIQPSTDADGNLKLVLQASKEELDSAPEYMTLAQIEAQKAAPPAAPAPAGTQ